MLFKYLSHWSHQRFIGNLSFRAFSSNFSSDLKRSYFQDTIYSLSTGYGKSAIAVIMWLIIQVIRISGDSAKEAIKLSKKKKYEEGSVNEIESRKVYFRRFYDIFESKIPMIDEGLLLYFQSP